MPIRLVEACTLDVRMGLHFNVAPMSIAYKCLAGCFELPFGARGLYVSGIYVCSKCQ
jgi:hypothetical protein